MAIFLVAYDLRRPGQNYDSLIKALSGFKHCRPQQSLWFIDAVGPASALRDIFAAHMDPNDILFVDPVSGAWAGKNMAACGKWLNDRGL